MKNLNNKYQKISILFVDDNILIRDIVKNMKNMILSSLK